MKLSVAIITFNEEYNIERTLKAIEDIADEIIIVDSHSADNTRAIATKFGNVYFYSEDWKGDGLQKQSAVDKCKWEWVLLLDADEVVSPRLKMTLVDLVQNEKADKMVYDIRMVCFVNDKPVRFGGWSHGTKRVLFNKKFGSVSEDFVHASWVSKLEIGKIKDPIFHYMYKNVHHHLEKMNSYTSDLAIKDYGKGKRINLFKVIVAPIFQFIKMYIFRLGFLDGITGFYLAVMDYFYFFLKYYKLYNYQKNKTT